MGLIYLEQSEADYAFAKYFLEQAKELYSYQEFPDLHLKTLLKLGLYKKKINAVEEAKDIFQDIEKKAVDFPLISLSSLYYQAAIAREEHQYQEAQQLLHKLERELYQLGPQQNAFAHFKIQIYNEKAQVFRHLKNWKQCLEQAELGINLMQYLNHQLVDVDAGINLKQTFYQLFELGVEACYELKNENEKYLKLGFDIMEQFKQQVQSKNTHFKIRELSIDSTLSLRQEIAGLKIEREIISYASNEVGNNLLPSD